MVSLNLAALLNSLFVKLLDASKTKALTQWAGGHGRTYALMEYDP
jgi:hypothetical protein